jgi:hypothetical protein
MSRSYFTKNDFVIVDEYAWTALHIDFINSGHLTLKEFARRQGIHYGYVRTRAGKERWLQNRRIIHNGACTDEGIAICDICKKAIKL